MLRARGYSIHFLHYALEGDDPARDLEIARAWDFHYLVPRTIPSARADPSTGYRIDDWWHPAVGERVLQLDEVWHYDICVVNYVWFSAALDSLSGRTLKIIDTHDVFADRHHRAVEAGIEPSWFYTSPAEEARGLARADIVLAIQEDEAAHFRRLGARDVATVGHVTPQRFQPPRRRDGRLRLGFAGSANLLNIRSLELFHQGLIARPALLSLIEIVVAGVVCQRIGHFNTLFRLLGTVPDLDSLYRSIDLAVAPMLPGTGLKIKVVDALSRGLPLLSTAAGTVGLGCAAPEHLCRSIDSLLDSLDMIARSDAPLDSLAAESRRIFTAYSAAQQRAFDLMLGRNDAAEAPLVQRMP